MKTILITMTAITALTTTASAAQLSISADQLFYRIGDTITLTVVGDAGDAPVLWVNVALQFAGSGSVRFITTNQVAQTHTLASGTYTWTDLLTHNRSLDGDESGAWALFQIACLCAGGPTPPIIVANDPFYSTVVLQAVGLGTVEVDFDRYRPVNSSGWPLGSFNFPGHSAPSNRIAFFIVPEPSTALLMCLGLVGLTARRRELQSTPRTPVDVTQAL